MPSLIITTNEDGSATVDAMDPGTGQPAGQPEQFDNAQDACMAAAEVLGGEAAGGDGEEGKQPGVDPQNMDGADSQQPQPQQGDAEAAMGAGYDRAKRGL
jgi:hypothetical protein